MMHGALTAALLAASGTAVHASGPVPLVMSGDAAPGAGGVVFASFGAAAVDESGDVVFLARLEGTGVGDNNSLGLWATTPGGLTLVARQGDVASDTGAVFDYFGAEPTRIAFRNGRVAFYASTTTAMPDGELYRGGIWSGTPGDLRLVAATGDPAPGTAGAIYSDFSNPSLNASGVVAFRGDLEPGVGDATSANGVGLWVGDPASPTLVARRGAAAPGTPGVYSIIYDASLADDGTFAFPGELELDVGGVTFMDDRGVWTGTATPGLLAREGYPVTGFPGMTYRIPSRPSMNNAGELLFEASVGGDTEGVGHTALWRTDGNFLTPEVRAAGGVAGVPGGRFSDFVSVVFGDTAVFSANLVRENGVSMSNDEGIWEKVVRGGATPLSLIAREGDPLPGTDLGMGDALMLRLGSVLVTNARQDIVFAARLRQGSAGVTSGNDSGLWARPGHLSRPILLAREGDLFDVDPDPLAEDLRAVLYIEAEAFTGGGDGEPTPLSDAGLLAFALVFQDGTAGVFTLDLAAIPCNAADFAAPRGMLDLADITAFVSAFLDGDPSADIDRNGILALNDVVEVVRAFNDGCP